MSAPELVAHRGHPAAFPENSGAGLADALAAGAAWVEIDVQLSADGTAWLYHDEKLARISGRRGRFADLTDAEAAALPVGEPDRLGARFADETALSLEAFAALLAAHPAARAFVEVKPVAVERFGAERALAATLAPLVAVRERVVLISFSLELLERARREPGLPLAPILKRWGQRDARAVRALEPEFVFCNVRHLPADGPIGLSAARLAVYEVVDPDLALALGRRGAELVETFEIRAMQAAFAARAAAPQGGSEA